MKKYAPYLVILALLLLFGYFIYPTRYLYLDTTFKSADVSFPVRVDRLTGKTQMLTQYGWLDFSREKSK